MIRDRRLGCFKFSNEAVSSFDWRVKRVMGMCVILEANYDYPSDSWKYLAISHLFYEVPMGSEPVNYTWVFDEDGDVTCKGDPHEQI